MTERVLENDSSDFEWHITYLVFFATPHCLISNACEKKHFKFIFHGRQWLLQTTFLSYANTACSKTISSLVYATDSIPRCPTRSTASYPATLPPVRRSAPTGRSGRGGARRTGRIALNGALLRGSRQHVYIAQSVDTIRYFVQRTRVFITNQLHEDGNAGGQPRVEVVVVEDEQLIGHAPHADAQRGHDEHVQQDVDDGQDAVLPRGGASGLLPPASLLRRLMLRPRRVVRALVVRHDVFVERHSRVTAAATTTARGWGDCIAASNKRQDARSVGGGFFSGRVFGRNLIGAAGERPRARALETYASLSPRGPTRHADTPRPTTAPHARNRRPLLHVFAVMHVHRVSPCRRPSHLPPTPPAYRLFSPRISPCCYRCYYCYGDYWLLILLFYC